MSQIFVFTAGNQDARQHLNDSILNPVSREIVNQTFSEELHPRLEQIEQKGNGFYAWGAVPGPRNKTNWGELKTEDWILCVYDNQYHFAARIIDNFDNEEFAEKVWGRDPEGNTWQFMYFLTKPEKVNVGVQDLSDYLNSSYRGFFRIGDEKLDHIRNDFGTIDEFMRVKFLQQNSAETIEDPYKDFWEIVQRYHSEGTVFQSAHKGALYYIKSIKDEMCTVERLTANEPASVSINVYKQCREVVKNAGGKYPFSDEFNSTAAVRTTLLQAVPFALTSDYQQIIDVAGTDKAVDIFIDYINGLKVDVSSGKPKLYKPAMIACVIEGIEIGGLGHNKITFDWIMPRFIERMKLLGEEVTERTAAMPFYHLTGELFWMLCYKDPHDRIHDGGEGPSAIREKVDHVILKDTFWQMLQGKANREKVSKVLSEKWFLKATEQILNVWWVNQGQTYDKERAAGYLWAPQANEQGRTFPHWQSMTAVKVGDIVINYANREIVAMSITKSKAVEHENEIDENRWHQTGWKVDMDYYNLNNPIKLDEIKPLMTSINATIQNNKPFNSINGINQGYLYNFSIEGLNIFSEQFRERIPVEILNLIDKVGVGYWIFQGNPEYFDVERLIKSKETTSWTVSRFKDQIKSGDKGFIWQAGPKGGVVGKFIVIHPPNENIKETHPDLWEKVTDDTNNLRCIIDITEDYTNKKLLKDDLIKENWGKNLTIIKSPQGTNFKISKEEFEKIYAILKGKSPISNNILSLLNKKKQIILYGPPGTGKTYKTKRIAVDACMQVNDE